MPRLRLILTVSKNDLPLNKYKIKFVPKALKEWHDLDGSVKEVLIKLLKKRLLEPRVPGAELQGELSDCYKIKLRKQGYRLVYQVIDQTLVVLILAVDKREKMAAYRSAITRLVASMKA